MHTYKIAYEYDEYLCANAYAQAQGHAYAYARNRYVIQNMIMVIMVIKTNMKCYDS